MNSSNFAVFALVFLIGLAFGGAVIWLLGRRRAGSSIQSPVVPGKRPSGDFSFRPGFIAVPIVVAVFTILSLTVLYSSLPGQVAYRFSSAGVPRDTIGREAFFVMMVGGQLLIVAASAGIASVVLRLARRMLAGSPEKIDPSRVIWLMVNMVVLPQLILAFVALDAAYYARVGTHIMTPWLFSLVTIGIGTIVIILLFSLSINETRQTR